MKSLIININSFIASLLSGIVVLLIVAFPFIGGCVIGGWIADRYDVELEDAEWFCFLLGILQCLIYYFLFLSK